MCWGICETNHIWCTISFFILSFLLPSTSLTSTHRSHTFFHHPQLLPPSHITISAPLVRYRTAAIHSITADHHPNRFTPLPLLLSHLPHLTPPAQTTQRHDPQSPPLHPPSFYCNPPHGRSIPTSTTTPNHQTPTCSLFTYTHL